LVACATRLSAVPVLTCSTNGGPFTSVGCYTSPSFSTLGTLESVDWQTALGPANQPAYNTTLNGPWTYTTPEGLTIGLTRGPGYQGTSDTLLRVDNFYRFFDNSTGTWRPFNCPTYICVGNPYGSYNTYMGKFDAPPDAGAGLPGDHLVSTNGNRGPLEIQFSEGIGGVKFRISTPTTGDVNATIAAYSVQNPTQFDTPIMTYTIKAVNAAGLCATLDNGFAAPQPCNVAPFLGIEGRPGDIRSVAISTTDNGGLYISSLYIDEVPEPGTLALFGSALVGLGVAARRRSFRR
jgi:hypothetical protein